MFVLFVCWNVVGLEVSLGGVSWMDVCFVVLVIIFVIVLWFLVVVKR